MKERLNETNRMRKLMDLPLITEQEDSRLDAKTNNHWKQLVPKLKSLGFSSNMTHHKIEGSFMYGTSDFDFWEERMEHKSGINISYPCSFLDYHPEYYPDFVWIMDGQRKPSLENNDCVDIVLEDTKSIKVSCGDYILQVINNLLRNK